MTLRQDKLDQVGKKLELLSLWLAKQMPSLFLQDLSDDTLEILCLHLIGFSHQDGLSHLHTKEGSFVFSANSPAIFAEILEHYKDRPIRSFRLFTSTDPLPLGGSQSSLCITRISFDSDNGDEKGKEAPQFEDIGLQELFPKGLKRSDFWQGLSKKQAETALKVFRRAELDEHCQYEILSSESKEELEIVFAWQDIQCRDLFLSSFAKMVGRYKGSFLDMNALFVKDADSTVLLFFTLEKKDLVTENFLEELVTLKYFLGPSRVEKTFVSSGLISGNEGNLVKAICSFVH